MDNLCSVTFERLTEVVVAFVVGVCDQFIRSSSAILSIYSAFRNYAATTNL